VSDDADIGEALARARALSSRGEDEAAKAAYLELLRRDPTLFDALNELGALAYASGHRSAARTAYEQAVRCHPGNPMGRVNLGNLLFEASELDAACAQYAAALAASPDFAEAHQGMARVLTELGEADAAAPHWQKGFAGNALATKRYRGTAPSVPLLLLVSAKGGNIPTAQWLDDRVFAISALYAEFFDPRQPLPPHAVIFNAIGDADLCGEALARAEEIAARSKAPMVNPPSRVRATGREANARRLAGIAGLIVPAIEKRSRAALRAAKDLRFPLLLRAPGFHTGRHFLRVDRHDEIAAALTRLPGEDVLAIQYLDARGPDGMARKYRVMVIDGVLYPLHLAVSADWKVHYFTADMAANATHRAEEQRFLDDMEAALGAPAIKALQRVGRTLGLDYAGIDFGLAPDGRVLLFEANATMVVNPPEPGPIWDYRRPAISRALDAAKRMVLARARL
jgi:glutathione synthase/RimK-type ligase-like ATP-grasp enzyme/Tfp pilus assembly protein PilF